MSSSSNSKMSSSNSKIAGLEADAGSIILYGSTTAVSTATDYLNEVHIHIKLHKVASYFGKSQLNPAQTYALLSNKCVFDSILCVKCTSRFCVFPLLAFSPSITQ